MPNLILTPCGTSLLTNGGEAETRTLITRHANAKTIDAIPEPDRAQLQARINQVEADLRNAATHDAAKRSAEINGIARFYDMDLRSARTDTHYLLATDTWLGSQTARLVAHWLTAQGIPNVQTHRQTDLQTADLDSFQSALSDLVRWCADPDIGPLPGYRHSGHHIAFNLTGGFKSVQGFLQTLAHFYADEAFYIFERSDKLLRIPRLPIALAETQTLRDHLPALRRLALGLPVAREDAAPIPETLLLRIGDETTLSPWGQILWDQARKDLYGKQLHPSPSDRIQYGPDLQKTLQNLQPDRLQQVQHRIDQLAQVLELGEQYNVPGLDFKPLSANPRPPLHPRMRRLARRGRPTTLRTLSGPGPQDPLHPRRPRTTPMIPATLSAP